VVAHSFADPTPYVAAAHEAGIKVIVQVQKVAHAKTAARAGVDAITAQGAEAGGHTGYSGTLPLVPSVIDALRANCAPHGGGSRGDSAQPATSDIGGLYSPPVDVSIPVTEYEARPWRRCAQAQHRRSRSATAGLWHFTTGNSGRKGTLCPCESSAPEREICPVKDDCL
jgi:hypothetical protein